MSALISFAISIGLLQLASPGPGTITEIRFVGNEHTRSETLLRETLIRPGDPVDAEQIESLRQAIMDLELFKTVRAQVEPTADGHVLVITVEEKRYFVVLPALGRSAEGDITYGGQARWDNLLGRGHRFEAEVKRKEFRSDADVDDERTLRLQYRYPRIGSGPWELDSLLQYQWELLEEERDGVTGDYDHDSRRLEFLASRWHRPGPSRGWRFGGGLSWEESRFDFVEGTPDLFFDATDVALLGRLGYRNVRNYELNREGRDFEFALTGFPELLGSTKGRLHASARYRVYDPITRRRFTNVNYQLSAAVVTRSLFGDPAFDLAGSSGLRGYPRGVIEGNAFVVANIEFVTPITRLDALRGVVFADAGTVLGDPDDAELATAGGLGLRWKLRSFVKVDLRLDVAHGFDGKLEGETKVYAGTDATF